MYEIKNRTALITGASKRIGQSIALRLARSGVNIVVHYNNSHEEAIRTKKMIEGEGVRAWVVHANLTDRTETGALISKTRDLAGSIDILINNASVFKESRIDQVSFHDLEIELQTNALSPLILSREFAFQTESGVIVNLLDTRVASIDTRHAAYFLSKRILLELTRMLALELAPKIRVSGVAPGLILPPPGKDVHYLEKMKHKVPLDAYGKPEDISDAILFLLTSDFITGQVIYVDGGRHLEIRSYE